MTYSNIGGNKRAGETISHFTQVAHSVLGFSQAAQSYLEVEHCCARVTTIIATIAGALGQGGIFLHRMHMHITSYGG